MHHLTLIYLTTTHLCFTCLFHHYAPSYSHLSHHYAPLFCLPFSPLCTILPSFISPLRTFVLPAFFTTMHHLTLIYISHHYTPLFCLPSSFIISHAFLPSFIYRTTTHLRFACLFTYHTTTHVRFTSLCHHYAPLLYISHHYTPLFSLPLSPLCTILLSFIHVYRTIMHLFC